MSTPDYDGRYSEECKAACQDGVCVKTVGNAYGCGSCCACLGGCHLGYEEQVAEVSDAASWTEEGEDHQ